MLLQLIVIGYAIPLNAQDYPGNSFKIELFSNANAILREQLTEITIESVDKMQIKKRRVVTVLNESGNHHVQAYTFYRDNIKIKDQKAWVFNSQGKEIKKFKKRNFEDRSYLSSGEMYGDSRLSYMNFKPTSYPYTVIYEEEYETNTTVFRTSWYPVETFNLSVEKSEYILNNPKAIPFRHQERNMDGLNLEKEISPTKLVYRLSDIPAFTSEKFSPDKSEFQPRLLVALEEFALVGVKGVAKDWKEFGKWQYDKLLEHDAQISQATLDKLKELTQKAKTDREKAKIVYDYVQNNTRYISVQLGIGGWEPMPASQVDALGYGDCKALTNYTRVLLETQGITSHYSVVWSGEPRDIDPEFTSMEGNHVILNIPQEDKDIWLECTSQTIPFDFLGDFTDNRYVLKLTPEGGELVKTPQYGPEANLTRTRADIELTEDSFTAQIHREKGGIAYNNIYPIERIKQRNQQEYYKEQWGYLGDFTIEELSFSNDRDSVKFREELSIKGKNFSSKAGNRLLLPVNFLQASVVNLPRNDSRRLPIDISRGESYEDSYRYYFPKNYEIESLPERIEVENEFGSLFIETRLLEGENRPALEVERRLIMKNGRWEAEKYEAYYQFLNQIKSYNNQKAVILTAS